MRFGARPSGPQVECLIVNKLLTAAVVLLAALVALQTLRLHRVQQETAGGSPASPAATERDDLAQARIMLEDPDLPGAANGTGDPMHDYLVEALATFLEDNESDGTGAPVKGSGKSGKARAAGEATGEAAKDAAAKRAAAEKKRARAKDAGPAVDEGAETPEYDPKRSKQLYNQARKLIQTGSYEAAAAALEESIATDPSNASSYRTLGALYRQLGMTAEEMQVYADWSAARPEDPLAHYYLANAYLRMGADAEVLAELGQFQELSADNLAAYPMAASLYRRLGMPDAEGAVLAQWVDDVPQSFDARQALAQHYQRTGQPEYALAEYQAAVSLIPDNVQARANLAAAYARLDMFSQAQAEYGNAIALRPNDAGLHYQLAEMYRRANDLASAMAAYQDVINLQPESSQAQRAARMMARIERQLNAPGKVLG